MKIQGFICDCCGIEYRDGQPYRKKVEFEVIIEEKIVPLTYEDLCYRCTNEISLAIRQVTTKLKRDGLTAMRMAEEQ